VVAAVLAPALVGGIWTVTGNGSFWHGFIVMALFNVVLLTVIVGVALAFARRDMMAGARERGTATRAGRAAPPPAAARPRSVDP
jgi:hypothetical protein